MAIALFPIAALLLLLSGVSSPAHATEPQPSTAAALMRGLFGSGHKQLIAGGHKVCRNLRASNSTSPDVLSVATRSGRNEGVVAETALAATPRAFTQKQYRTRFGFADGAYQAIGPPSHGPRLDLGWFQG